MPDVHTAAESGLVSGAGPLPYLDRVQESFGRHDVAGIQAYSGGATKAAAQAIGATAYATGDKVGFGEAPSLHTTAHEAAHVVQQRSWMSLKGGAGQAGDAYERHADSVANSVVQGRSAEGLLDQMTGGAEKETTAPVQRAVQRRVVEPLPYPPVSRAVATDFVAKFLVKKYDSTWGSRPLKKRLSEFVSSFTHPDFTLWYRMCQAEWRAAFPGRGRRIGGGHGFKNERKIWDAGHELFQKRYAVTMYNLMAADPNQALRAWQYVCATYPGHVESNIGAKWLKAKVQSTLIDKFAAAATKDAAKSSGKSSDELMKLADVQLRQVISIHRLDFYQGVLSGVATWQIKSGPPSAWPDKVSGAGATAGALSSIVTIGATTGTAVATLGLGFVVASAGAAIWSAWKSHKDKKKAYNEKAAQGAIKRVTLEEYAHFDAALNARTDSLCIILAVDALKAGIDPGKVGKDELRKFCWKRMYGNLPTNKADIGQRVRREMDRAINGYP